MPNFEIDTEKLQLAVQLYDYSQKQIEESLYKFKALSNDFQADMQLQMSMEFPQIQDICSRYINSSTVLEDRMRELYAVFVRIPSIFNQLEEKSKARIADVVHSSGCTGRNINDAAAIALAVATEVDEEVNVFTQVTALVQNNSSNLALASTACASSIIEDTYAGDEELHSDVAIKNQVLNSTISVEASLMDLLGGSEDE